MITMIKKRNRNLIKNYNDQIDVINKYFIERNEYLEKKNSLERKHRFTKRAY